VSTHQFAYAQKRRSTRIDQAIPLLVQGVGAMREPYQEHVSTVSISCHGCTYVSKHEVIQGEIVYMDIKPPNGSSVGCSSRARVKWAQKFGAKERAFQIAVEFEIAGNVWGVATPPGDWFPRQVPEAVDTASLARELKVVHRKEQPAIPVPNAESNRLAVSTRDAVAAPPVPQITHPVPQIAQLMVGLGEQIQSMAAQAAAAALVKEKGRLIEEFRAQLRDETVKTIQSAILASKEVMIRQALKELSEAQEVAARNSHAQWRKNIEQDLECARQHTLNQGKEASQRLEAMAASTIERVQAKLDATRGEAVDRLVSRIRDQIVPMLDVAKDSLRKLEGAQGALRKESEAIFAGLENQLAYSTNEIFAKSQEELEKSGAAICAKTNESMLKLSQDFEKSARDSANSLLASAGSQMIRILHEKAADASREFSTGLEGYTRTYLESIGKSIAEIPQKLPGRSS
jgi:hypothetical protein